MVEPNNDIMEEMYGFLYEVTSTETENTLPIYCTYTIQQEDRINKKEITRNNLILSKVMLNCTWNKISLKKLKIK